MDGDILLEGGGKLLEEGGAGALLLEIVPYGSSRDPNQTRTFTLQVFRSGNWVDIPVQSAQGSVQKNQAGSLQVVIPGDPTDPYRARLYEGEKCRAYRGVVGSSPVRCWTGFVDVPTATDSQDVIRNPVITDNMKDLNDAILLSGVVYDTLTPNYACADVINQAIVTGQLVLSDDAGDILTSTVGYNAPGGNGICYFPDSINFDGSLLALASGTLGSFAQGNNAFANFVIPLASGQSYSAFELQAQYIIASTMVMGPGFELISTSTSLPPASGTCICDFYNGIFYFNAVDASKTASFSAFYYTAPLWAFPPGTSCGAVLSQIWDKVGARWSVDAYGKYYAKYIDTIATPTRVLGRSEYGNLQIQSNRDRRNVIICEGWDGNCGQIFTAKCINYEDIIEPPPTGLGRRSYIIIQDPTWKSRTTINNACYYAAQQISRRGKVMSVQMIDDPTLILEDVLCFSGAQADATEGDFFYIEGIQWNWALAKNAMTATTQITGTGLPGQGTMYLGPATAVTAQGFFDFSSDVLSMENATLAPPGGKYSSSFSIATGLNLNYNALENGYEAIDIYGSDGSHLGPYQTNRSAGPLSIALPVSSMEPGLWYVIKLRYEDAAGNLAIYRTFIQSYP
jgi:hypothetical protein